MAQLPSPTSVPKRVTGLVLLALGCVCVCMSHPARAEPPSAPSAAPSGYASLIESALQELADQHFEEARALLTQAHAIHPNARTLRGLGMVEFELRNYASAIELLEQALTSEEKTLDPSLRAATETLLARARGFVGTVHLDVRPEGHRASVLVDGVPVHLTKGGCLTLEVGDHLVEVHEDGYLPERRKVSVRGGEREMLRIALRNTGGAGDLTRERTPLLKNAWLWSGIAFVLAGAAAATAVTLSRPEERSSVADGGNTGIVLGGPKP